jgi:hypothetical protein
MQALHALARAHPGRIVVVRGLATLDFMRRTLNHANAQSLANNLCKDAIGVLADGRQAAYATYIDMDEFLSPPTANRRLELFREQPLSGALSQLASYLHSGRPPTELYIRDKHTVASRVHAGVGKGRCLSFAGVYYRLPACANGSATALDTPRDDSRPALLRMSWRVQPDHFEAGLSHNWTAVREWNFNVHAKYLADATDASHLAGNHECCCEAGKDYVRSKCISRQGLAHGAGTRHACASVEFMPLEYWHVRHLRKSSGIEPSRSCQVGAALKLTLHRSAADHAGKGVWLHATAAESESGDFPLRWAQEYAAALHEMAKPLGLTYPWTVGRNGP